MCSDDGRQYIRAGGERPMPMPALVLRRTTYDHE